MVFLPSIYHHPYFVVIRASGMHVKQSVSHLTWPYFTLNVLKCNYLLLCEIMYAGFFCGFFPPVSTMLSVCMVGFGSEPPAPVLLVAL